MKYVETLKYYKKTLAAIEKSVTDKEKIQEKKRLKNFKINILVLKLFGKF